MMTKNEFCKYFITKFRNQNKREPIPTDAFSSTCLGLSMEYLGMLKDDPSIKEYLSNRAGLFINYYDKEKDDFISLSFRDMIDILPN